MRLAFLSDIHGNSIALEAALEDLRKRRTDHIFVLGDICFRGPNPQKCLQLVQSLNATVIKGNADEWIIRGIKEGEVPNCDFAMMQQEREWACSRLDEESIHYLKHLPAEIEQSYDGMKLHAFHAAPDNLFDVIQSNEEEKIISTLMKKEADVYVYGHIHRSYIKYLNGKCVVNIGSIGLPFDGLNKASYALLDIEDAAVQASIIRVRYDINKVIEQWAQSDYPNKEKMINIVQNGRL
ncbi:metallophosphoesterase family protein [Heyndrickxia acidicola]|uniref:Phosphoesterase n=1 Tax=Heyndrickxia acidicola TaxID=209389 RepID=A0ABU6MQ97_9BACI|nr:metallophosphoesterase family protein [Heyndrickxia acidicola]MED1205215.1 metallophosphoesterase family protein [Heyndrickxia acidicola]